MNSITLRLLAGVLAVGAALAGYLGYRASQPVKVATAPTVAPAPENQAVFAARDIPPGHIITTADVTLSPVPEIASRAFTTQDQVIGQTPWVAVASGELILSHQFLSKSALARTVQPGERAVAVAIDEASGVGGFVQPGDEVDVLLYLDADRETAESSAQIVLRGARVLAFGNQQESPPREARKTLPEEEPAAEEGARPEKVAKRLARRAAEDQAEEPTGKTSRTAVLAVRVEDASRLMLAQSAGKLRLALHGIAPGSEPAALHEVALAGGHTSSDRSSGDRSTADRSPSDRPRSEPRSDRYYLPLRSLAGGAPLPRPTAPRNASTGARGIFVHKGDVLEVVHPGASRPPPAPAPAALGLPLTLGAVALPTEAAK